MRIRILSGVIMPAYMIAGFCTAALLLFILIKPDRAIYLKNLTLPLLGVLFILALILFPETSVNAALKGIRLWLDIVFPSLFPFFVASEVLNSTGFVRAAGVLLEPIMRPLFKVPGCGSFALAMGITSGYPVGARITCSLLENGDISRHEAERLLAFTNNSGPLFIVGAVATGMYGIPSLGLFLLACHIAASFTVGVLLGIFTRGADKIPERKEKTFKKFQNLMLSGRKKKMTNAGMIFGDAVKNSVSLIIAIGAFIIFFSVVINILLETNIIGFLAEALALILSPAGISPDMISAVLSGFFEITTGTNLASKVTDIPIAVKLSFTSLIIGWAGLSVHSQVYSITGDSGISMKPYFLGKFLHGMIAAVFTWIGMQFEFINALANSPVLGSERVTAFADRQNVLFNSLTYLVFVLLIYGMFCLGAFLSKSFKKKI
ncbi:MAG: sporulation integral membrane protein YlbJ [Ruminiclostridium sp.]|nr:sporulation integral membrane protein YlbJ [Ruminiclostridium sp.]